MGSLFWVQICVIGLLIVSAIAMGVEIFINNIKNTAAIEVWGIIAIVCLNLYAAIAIYRLRKSSSTKERFLAIFLILMLIAFWIAKAVDII